MLVHLDVKFFGKTIVSSIHNCGILASILKRDHQVLLFTVKILTFQGFFFSNWHIN